MPGDNNAYKKSGMVAFTTSIYFLHSIQFNLAITQEKRVKKSKTTTRTIFIR